MSPEGEQAPQRDGLIELTSITSSYASQLTVTSGTLTNASDGEVRTTVGNGGSRTLTALLDNQGLVTVNQPLTFNKGSAAHTNSGTINVNADLTVSQTGTLPSFTNSGTLTIAATRTLQVNSGTFTHQTGATLNGGGELSLSGVTAALNEAFTVGALTLTSSTTLALTPNISTGVQALTLSNSTINGPGTITNPVGQTLTLTSSTIGATSALINEGTVVGYGGNVVNGPYTAAAGSTLRLRRERAVGGEARCRPGRGEAEGHRQVTAVAGDSVTVNSGGKDWIFKVDAKTDVIARGGSTATRAAQAAGAPGPKLGDNIKVGEGVEITYTEEAGALHAKQIRGDVSVPSAPKAPESAKKKAMGKVTAVAGDTVTVNADGKDWAFKVDGKTDIVAAGGSTARRAAQAAGGAGPKLGDIVKVGDQVEVEHDLSLAPRRAGAQRHPPARGRAVSARAGRTPICLGA